MSVGLFLVAGCYSNVRVKPYAESTKPAYIMACGEIKYSGNKRYLPSTVSACEAVQEHQYTIEFLHEQDYTGTKAEYEVALSMLPSYILGTPTGMDKVLAYSILKISRDGKELATYRAACVKESYRSIFSGAVDNSEGRVQCLDALKLNIENQMLRDEDFWTKNAVR